MIPFIVAGIALMILLGVGAVAFTVTTLREMKEELEQARYY